jgi:hypothetical protein
MTRAIDFRDRISFHRRLGRVVAGFALGWHWSSLVLLAWLLVAMAVGKPDMPLDGLKDKPWSPYVIPAILASSFAAWVGSTITPVLVGPTRFARPVFASAAVGALAAAAWMTLVGTFVGRIIWQFDPTSPWLLTFPLALSVPLGLLCGWVVARMIAHFYPPNKSRRSDTSE